MNCPRLLYHHLHYNDKHWDQVSRQVRLSPNVAGSSLCYRSGTSLKTTAVDLVECGTPARTRTGAPGLGNRCSILLSYRGTIVTRRAGAIWILAVSVTCFQSRMVWLGVFRLLDMMLLKWCQSPSPSPIKGEGTAFWLTSRFVDNRGALWLEFGG